MRIQPVPELILRARQRSRLPTVEAQLVDWIEEMQQPASVKKIQNVMLQRGGFQIYLRHTTRELAGTQTTCLDIGRIAIPERLRSRGWFTRFLQIAAAVSPWEAIYIECVQNPRLADHLRRNPDWTEVRIDGSAPNFFRRTRNNPTVGAQRTA